jgi:hypothetical protein
LGRAEGEKRSGKDAAVVAPTTCGLLALTILFLMAPTSTTGGVVHAAAGHGSLSLIGVALIASGAGLPLCEGIRIAPGTVTPLSGPLR